MSDDSTNSKTKDVKEKRMNFSEVVKRGTATTATNSEEPQKKSSSSALENVPSGSGIDLDAFESAVSVSSVVDTLKKDEKKDAGESSEKEASSTKVDASLPPKPTNAIKLFVGQIPRNMLENHLRPLFEEFGTILDINIIRDRTSGAHRGCAFVTFTTKEAAERAIDKYHNKKKLPNMHNAMQVKKAHVHKDNRKRPTAEIKLFVGMVPHSADENAIAGVFGAYGDVEEIYILKTKGGESRGCAFVRYTSRAMALKAIDALHDKYTMEGGPSPLVVKFADSKRMHSNRRQGGRPSRYMRNRNRMGGGKYGNRGNYSNRSSGTSPGNSSSNGVYGGQYGNSSMYGYMPQGYGGTYGTNQAYYGYQYGGAVYASPPSPTYPGSSMMSYPGYFPSSPGTYPGQMMRREIEPCTVFISGLPTKSSYADLSQLLQRFGGILEVQITTRLDSEEGQYQGSGMVIFDSRSSAAIAEEHLHGSAPFGDPSKTISIKIQANESNDAAMRVPDATGSSKAAHDAGL